MKRTLALTLALSLVAAPAFAQGAAAQQTRIGAAAAVAGLVKAQMPGAVGRVIGSGKPLFLNDHVTSDAQGRLQVLLLDETVFTLGPNADMVLDEFVYDPANDAGKVTARVTKGVFRFVTGKVARRDPANMKVKLPVGTIGIRGTIVLGEASETGSTVILMGPGSHGNSDEPKGAASFEAGGVTRNLDQPGEGVTCAAGGAPSPVKDMSDTANQLQGRLSPPADEKKAQSGGAGGGSATEESGQQTASAKSDSGEALQEAEANQDSSDLLARAQQDAAQKGIADGVATWESIRSNITTGQGFYFNGDSVVSCSGCASAAPEGTVQLQIDFGARTVGGTGGITNPVSTVNGSFIHLHGLNNAGNTDTVQQTIGLVSFASLAGSAVLTLKTSPVNPGDAALGSLTDFVGGAVPGGTSGSFNNSTITLVNSGGVAASQAKVNFTFSGTNSASGAASASGQFVAPR